MRLATWEAEPGTISVDASGCAYCGSCVGVYPVGVLDLPETRMVVSDNRTDCGPCVPVCATGALSSSQEARGWSPRAKREYDVVVIGAGPVGSPARLVTDGTMLVEDAAHQAGPLTGGGIANPMAAARLAVTVAADCIAAGDVSWVSLRRHQEEWSFGIGRGMTRNYRLRARFPPHRRVGERFLYLLAMSVGAERNESSRGEMNVTSGRGFGQLH